MAVCETISDLKLVSEQSVELWQSPGVSSTSYLPELEVGREATRGPPKGRSASKSSSDRKFACWHMILIGNAINRRGSPKEATMCPSLGLSNMYREHFGSVCQGNGRSVACRVLDYVATDSSPNCLERLLSKELGKH